MHLLRARTATGRDSQAGRELAGEHRLKRGHDLGALEDEPANVIRAHRVLDDRQRVVRRNDALAAGEVV